ncbi:MAG: hypothetical protein CVU36_08645 [Betaproteobacteria bacterium HGW-Betaproteobacteria-9]|jgi:hypothetical protein|nr:MAG: hypothetical protein CVU36_08645 [Betaproteobacteria bacterium HGW-Betaproteobacteria-9]
MSQAINVEHLRLVLASAKLRRYTSGGTCLLAAYTAAPLLRADCSSRSRQRMREDAVHRGEHAPMVTLMERGHVAELILRTRMNHGLAEVRKTWGAGLRSLQAEPRHVLNGGAA